MVDPKVRLVRSSSLYRSTSVMRECVHIQTHYSRIREFMSLQHIIMQAASKSPSESLKWKCTRHWTRRSTTLGTWSWPQKCD